MREIELKAAQAYRSRFGGEPEVIASAPGRVNIIGEHTDYNGGFVLPCAIGRRVAVAVSRGNGGLYSSNFDEMQARAARRQGSWVDYPNGVAWALGEAGHSTSQFQAAFAGDVPLGGGLSSSAAIEAATALALDALFNLSIPRPTLAKLCRRAENDFLGLQSGIMDQYASLLSEADAALFLDCRSLDARLVPLRLQTDGLGLFVCDTRVERSLGSTGYNDRQATCVRAARTLGVRELRDAGVSDLSQLSGDELKRARHVVTENGRVLAAVKALDRQDFSELGRLMFASHASLRDDFEVSTAELDAFVEIARQSGALGARMTGAGFGGCALGLIPSEREDELKQLCRHRFLDLGFKEPTFYQVRPTMGAELAP
jgi:galactokinase